MICTKLLTLLLFFIYKKSHVLLKLDSQSIVVLQYSCSPILHVIGLNRYASIAQQPLTVVLVVVGWQFCLVAPWSELMFFVSVRRTSPHLDVDVLVSSHSLVIAGEHEEKGKQDAACS